MTPVATFDPNLPLSTQGFEAARQVCGATEAYIVGAQGQRAITFRGVATDFNARQAQAQCLEEHLKGTDEQFVGFLSEPPAK